MRSAGTICVLLLLSVSGCASTDADAESAGMPPDVAAQDGAVSALPGDAGVEMCLEAAARISATLIETTGKPILADVAAEQVYEVWQMPEGAEWPSSGARMPPYEVWGLAPAVGDWGGDWRCDHWGVEFGADNAQVSAEDRAISDSERETRSEVGGQRIYPVPWTP